MTDILNCAKCLSELWNHEVSVQRLQLIVSVFLVFNECISLGAQLQSDKGCKIIEISLSNDKTKTKLSTSSYCLLWAKNAASECARQ